MQRPDLSRCQFVIMKAHTFLLSLLLGSMSCSKNEQNVSYLKCKVTATSDLACNRPRIDFTEDSVALKKITGKNGIVYVVDSLPLQLNVQNKQLYIVVREPKSSESFFCNTLGVFYPALMVTDAKAR